MIPKQKRRDKRRRVNLIYFSMKILWINKWTSTATDRESHVVDYYFEDEAFQTDSFHISAITFNDYLEPYLLKTQTYVHDLFQKSNAIDNVDGPIYDFSVPKWMLGNKVINSDEKNGRV